MLIGSALVRVPAVGAPVDRLAQEPLAEVLLVEQRVAPLEELRSEESLGAPLEELRSEEPPGAASLEVVQASLAPSFLDHDPARQEVREQILTHCVSRVQASAGDSVTGT